MSAETRFRYTHSVGLMAERGRGFLNPSDMAIRADGTMYVINRGHAETALRGKRITRCNIAGDYLGEFSAGGTGDGELMWPSSIAIDDETLYVSDEALQCISILDGEGILLGKWGEKGAGDGQFDRPAGICFDVDGNLLVVDGVNSRVQRYTKEGQFLGGWGRSGSGDGEFNFPWGISVDQAGNMYVADWRNDRIQKFDPDGGHLASWGTPGQGDGQFNRPSWVAVDREGHVYVADRGNERVQVLGPDGQFLAKLRGEGGFSKWADEWFGFSNHQQQKELWEQADLEPDLDPAASDFLSYESGSIVKLFWGPTSIKIDAQGDIYILETCRQRIQVYRKEW